MKASLEGVVVLRFACPACNSVMTAPPRKAGHKLNCLKCGQRIQIPSPSPRGTRLARPLPPKGPPGAATLPYSPPLPPSTPAAPIVDAPQQQQQQQKRKRPADPWFWPLVGIILLAAVVLFGCVIGGFVLWVAVGDAAADLGKDIQRQQQQGEQKRPTKPRDEFKALVMGKEEHEVIKILGKPEANMEKWGDEGGDSWRYDRVSLDPTAGKIDGSAWVNFDRSGKVSSVQFSP